MVLISTILRMSICFRHRDSSQILTLPQTSTQQIQWGKVLWTTKCKATPFPSCGLVICLRDRHTKFFIHNFQMKNIFFLTKSWLAPELRTHLFWATFAVSCCHRCKTPKNPVLGRRKITYRTDLQIAYIEVQFRTEGVSLKCPKATVDITSFCWA